MTCGLSPHRNSGIDSVSEALSTGLEACWQRVDEMAAKRVFSQAVFCVVGERPFFVAQEREIGVIAPVGFERDFYPVPAFGYHFVRRREGLRWRP